MNVRNLLLLMSVVISNSALAAFHCEGKVDDIAIRHSGGVSVFSGEMWGEIASARDICNLEAEWKGISKETCNGWLTQILAAKATNNNVKIQYTTDGVTCETMPAWGYAYAPHAIRTE